ncbi:GNAT family N-acetyltransferase [Burkholderia sp. FERM BP-3421]|uniref:GNAT family N-acetyltransferase n=1 Tax=Burkholderia sp. FERM BP-3421 TaxID=1494466 RepID=UPI002361E59E|nr:GNAT family N-acetyltransferase [Burkholderia sp. FERM BP-3421]WDD91329.1 GNAT family N-acetyltransferase [Burkholderia sp. FERM BP-3421]
MTDRRIRRAVRDDVPLLRQIRRDAIDYKLSRGDAVWGKTGWSETDAHARLDRGGWFIIEQDGVPAGILSLQWDDEEYWGPQAPDAGYLHNLGIRNGLHGLGLGSYAVDWCAAQVRANHRSRLRLDCDARNEKLCAYYASRGFRQVKVMPLPSGYVASLYERNVG